MKFGLEQETIDKISEVFRKYPEVTEAIIYGSRAKGNYRKGSDIDFCLKGENLTGELSSKIFLDLDDLNTPYLYDISLYGPYLSPDLQVHIDRVGQVFYKKKV